MTSALEEEKTDNVAMKQELALMKKVNAERARKLNHVETSRAGVLREKNIFEKENVHLKAKADNDLQFMTSALEEAKADSVAIKQELEAMKKEKAACEKNIKHVE